MTCAHGSSPRAAAFHNHTRMVVQRGRAEPTAIYEPVLASISAEIG